MEANRDLLNFIERYDHLKTILASKEIKGREDLVDVIVSGALEKIGSDSPIKESDLREDPTLAMFIAGNIGGLADILKSDRGLAQAIVNRDRVEESTIINHVVRKVADYLGASSPITEDFLLDHPEATIHLLLNPYTLSRVKEDQALARKFVAEAGSEAATYDTEIAQKAKELVGMPTLFSTTFFERNKAFARMVVASALNGEPLKLPSFIKTNPDLTSRYFSEKELIEAYETKIAQERFPSNFPLDGEFFARNRSIVIAVIGSDRFVENLKGSEKELKDLFRSDRLEIGKDLFKILMEGWQKSPSGIINIYI